MRNIFEFLNDEEKKHFLSSYKRSHEISNDNMAVYHALQMCKRENKPEHVMSGAFIWSGADCPSGKTSDGYWHNIAQRLCNYDWND